VFRGFNYSVRKRPRSDDRLGLLGNDLLKRFQVVLDNQGGVLYLRSNSHVDDAYRNPERVLARVLVGAVLLGLCAGAWRARRARSGRVARSGMGEG